MDYATISKGMIGRLAKLKLKKYRDAERMFVAEGTKCVLDTITHFEVVCVVATDCWLNENAAICPYATFKASISEMARISSLSTPADVIAVYKQPQLLLDESLLHHNLTLLLDDIQDPGNLGTIVRLADWFGVKQIVASPATADIFNAKAVQATMGSISRVNIFYRNLPEFIKAHTSVPTVGLLLDGENIYTHTLPNVAFIVMGNEGKGLSEAVRALVCQRLLIPSYPPGEPSGESLNVATATAITLSEFRRRLY